MKRQGGFTLIELVVVIVILGILAVTAAPRFLNLQDDARKASLQGLKGAIDGASGIAYGKAAVEGKETIDASKADEDDKPEVEGIKITFGYPTFEGLKTAVTGLSDDWDEITVNNNKVYTFKGKKADSDWVYDPTGTKENVGCYVGYIEATGTTADKAAKTVIASDKC
ncbi:type II secretion system protein [Vibrio diabolicus]|uniref:type II secretion system protein n=1 Tax=Vibrio diabolicus TaxID=50719 RepID=UPI00193C78D4|nr:type II secretion system protein [Vibrio diabolicus]